MRIGIDGWPLSGRPTGIGRYVRELCLELANTMPEAKFFLYSPRPIDFPPRSGWHMRQDSRSFPFLPGYLWLKWRAGDLCSRDSLDVFWSTRTLSPCLPPNVPIVSTVHDLNYRLVPETMPIANRWAHRLWFRTDVLQASAVMAISQGTSDRLAAEIGRSADAVISPAVSPRYRPQAPEQIDRYRARYALQRPYLLSVGTVEPRKNVHSLAQAFTALRQQGLLQKHELVLAGGDGWHTRSLKRRLSRNSADGIRFLGYVPEDDLPALYSGADLFVFPSLYEGFGMPVLEARACGTRLLVADSPELREAGGEHAHYVPPTVAGLCNGIQSALNGTKPTAALDAHSLPSWKQSALILAGLLTKAARQRL